jgi:hypothetical protein
MQNNISKQNKKGQILLIAVMLLATIITVVMTVAFNSTTETQIARLEIDSQKALAAAEAGIDAAIKQPIDSTIQIGNLGQFSSQGISGNAQVASIAESIFVTPLLQKDEQYTLYLSNYPEFPIPWNGKFDIYLVSEATQCPSIEVIIIKKIVNTYEMDRYAYNTCSPGIINNALNTTPTTEAMGVVDSVLFRYKTGTSISVSNGIVAFVKVLGGRTKLGFKNTDSPIVSFSSQGKTIDSEARTESGVVKKLQLFQSFPQIPSNFFMTSF